MNEKYKSLTKAELLAYMLQNRFYELFLGQPKKARDLINDLWNMMIPYVQEFLYGHTEDFEEVVLPPNAPDDRDCPDEYDIEEHLQ